MVKSSAELVSEARAQIESISPQELADEMAAGQVVVLDVREPVEWEHHIEGAVEVPRGIMEFVADPANPRHNEALDPAKRVVVYCNSGGRASLATKRLQTLGFTNVANLAGGFTAWREADLPTTEHHSGL